MNFDSYLSRDIENVRQIPIVSTMLEVVCRTTGMGFAAIARVTEDRWIVCSVKDEISFGLEIGGELPIETTICNEIRDAKKAVIIDNVSQDPIYCNHHTPKIYGFQSYISVPIFLKNGEFFGTLCAIDPAPAKLNNAQTIGMFKLFTDLISYHLNSIDILDKNNASVLEINRRLIESNDENRQYQHISSHNLQEPLRKIRMFSSLLTEAAEQEDMEKVKNLALKVNVSAQKFSMMIKDLSDFSGLNDSSFQSVDLKTIISDVCSQLNSEPEAKNIEINVSEIPVIEAVPFQMEQLFYHLIHNSIKFSKRNSTPAIGVKARMIPIDEVIKLIPAARGFGYVEILMEDNGIGIEQSQLENIFDMFSQLPSDAKSKGRGVGLSYCRKIIRNHHGSITAQSELGKGTRFRIILPLSRY
jgi:signal transduction histidine kinase